jgi:hypothetical protein
MVATGGNPLAGAFAATVINAMLQDQTQELEQITEQLKLIRADTQASKADTQALREEPYKTGREYLREAAQPYMRGAKDKRRFVEKAHENFMRARSLAQNLFSKALIEREVGNCWVLLGNNDGARHWFQRAYYSAADYWAECAIRNIARSPYTPLYTPLLSSSQGTSSWATRDSFPWLCFQGVVLDPSTIGISNTTLGRAFYSDSPPTKDSPLFGLTNALEQLRSKQKALAFKVPNESDSTRPRQSFFKRFMRLRRAQITLSKERGGNTGSVAGGSGGFLGKELLGGQRGIYKPPVLGSNSISWDPATIRLGGQRGTWDPVTKRFDVQQQPEQQQNKQQQKQLKNQRQLKEQKARFLADFRRHFQQEIASHQEPPPSAKRAWWSWGR